MAKKAKKTRKIIRKTTEAKHEVEKSMKPERVVGKKQIPAGVMIIAIMGFISCAIFLIGGIIFILGGIIFSINPITIEFPPEIPAQIASAMNQVLVPALFIMGLILVISTLIIFFISRGLWRLKNWARITVIILSVLMAVSAFFSIMGGELKSLLGLAINVIVAAYLIFSENVKNSFS